MHRHLARSLAATIGIGIGLAALELALEVRAGDSAWFYVWWPHLEKVSLVAPGVMPGIEGTSVFRANSRGLRGDEPPAVESFHILCVGGSTTECLFLDQSEAWPAVLQEELRRAGVEPVPWVENAGKSGLSSRDLLVLMRTLLPRMETVDLVVLLVGANDLGLRLAQDEDYDPLFMTRPEGEARTLERAFGLMPAEQETRVAAWKCTELWRLAARFRDRFAPHPTAQDDAGAIYEIWRSHRRSAVRMRDEAPDLEPSLGEYRANLASILDLCAQRSVGVLLLTQPTVWDADVSREVERLLWLGGVGDFMAREGCEYYTPGVLRLALDRYNAALLEVARARGLEVCDLASSIPRDTAAFYDDMHFNENGARLVARSVAEHLFARPELLGRKE